MGTNYDFVLSYKGLKTNDAIKPPTTMTAKMHWYLWNLTIFIFMFGAQKSATHTSTFHLPKMQKMGELSALLGIWLIWLTLLLPDDIGLKNTTPLFNKNILVYLFKKAKTILTTAPLIGTVQQALLCYCYYNYRYSSTKYHYNTEILLQD